MVGSARGAKYIVVFTRVSRVRPGNRSKHRCASVARFVPAVASCCIPSAAAKADDHTGNPPALICAGKSGRAPRAAVFFLSTKVFSQDHALFLMSAYIFRTMTANIIIAPVFVYFPRLYYTISGAACGVCTASIQYTFEVSMIGASPGVRGYS